jgi:hypothetical protein
MHTHPGHPAAGADHRAVGVQQEGLATVTFLANARRRGRLRSRRAMTSPHRHRNVLAAWLLHLLAATMDHSCVIRTSMPSLSGWAELISAANDDAHTDDAHRVRIEVTPVQTAQFAAIEHICAVLADLDAQPRLDIEVACTTDRLVLTLRGILADPVMAPRTADALTEALQAAAGQQRWYLDVTDAGSLRWELQDAYTATLP